MNANEGIAVFCDVGKASRGANEDVALASRVVLASARSEERILEAIVVKASPLSERRVEAARFVAAARIASEEGVAGA
jgi:hypothetical protein